MNELLKKNYDLEERTAQFGENVIDLCKLTPQDIISRPIINQLVRSSTGIGANYKEANSASSRKDFKNKIYICKKEAQETHHWLRMMKKIDQQNLELLEKLWVECSELILIFGKILVTLKNSDIKNSLEIKNS